MVNVIDAKQLKNILLAQAKWTGLFRHIQYRKFLGQIHWWGFVMFVCLHLVGFWRPISDLLPVLPVIKLIQDHELWNFHGKTQNVVHQGHGNASGLELLGQDLVDCHSLLDSFRLQRSSEWSECSHRCSGVTFRHGAHIQPLACRSYTLDAHRHTHTTTIHSPKEIQALLT